MACGGCAKRRAARVVRNKEEEASFLANTRNLNQQQLNVRLEKYKRKYCSNEPCRYECDYGKFVNCKKRLK